MDVHDLMILPGFDFSPQRSQRTQRFMGVNDFIVGSPSGVHIH